MNGFDRDFYHKYLRDGLPDEIYDSHAHIWTKDFVLKSAAQDAKTADWVHNFCADHALAGDELPGLYTRLFEGKKVSSLVFGWVENNVDVPANNRYVGGQVKKNPVLRGLAVSKAAYSPDELLREVEGNGLIGLKPYPSFAPENIPPEDVRITDMITAQQLSLANEREWVVLLHIPRAKRLADRANIEDIMTIERNFPHIRLIVAHIGRAYCMEDIGEAFEVLKDTKNVMFDFAAHTNAEVFQKTLAAFGPGRILFGSDLPITTMRLRREHRDGRYINIVPAGSCGDVSADPHMREAAAEEAEGITFFLYESIAAMLRAAGETGLTQNDIGRIFYRNAKDFIG